MRSFLSGMVTTGFLVGALFFARFWSRYRDFLFLAFSIAFCLLALNQVLATVGSDPSELHPRVYVLRLAAFLLIAVAIARKNAGRRAAPPVDDARSPTKHDRFP